MAWFPYGDDDWRNDNRTPRYKRQMENVEFLLLDTIQRKKEVNIDIDDLRKVMDTLYDYRFFD